MAEALLLWWLIDSGWAQMEVCPGPLAVFEWQEAMTAVDQALAALDGARADRILDDMVHELRCLQEIAAPADLGRMARQMSLVAFYAQDHEEMQYWGLLARETVGSAPWPVELPIPDRYFELLDELPEPAIGRSEGGLDVPRGGGALIDGRLITEPVASVGVEHLLQIADRQGVALATLWQMGAAFPEEWKTEEPIRLDVPKWYQPPPDEDRDPAPEAPPELEAPAPPATSAPRAPPEPAPAARRPRPAGRVGFDGDGRTADCPWRVEPHTVEASGREVRINRRIYPVRSEGDQAAFKAVLRSCGEFRAARRFTRWRDARGSPFSGAGAYKAQMIEALLTEEPKRPRRRPASGASPGKVSPER